jgi:hypothetical protein
MTRTLLPLAVLAMVAMLSAGCLNAAAKPGTSSSAAETNAAVREQSAKFAQCMRSNGVKQFPDADASGTYTIDGLANGLSLDTNSAAFKQALAACKDLQPAGFTGHKRSAQEQENAVKFAQCIRDNGVKDFPDPDPDGPLIDTTRMPGNPDGRNILALQAAMQKCRDLASNAGVSAGR